MEREVENVEILRWARDVVLDSADKWTTGSAARDAHGVHCPFKKACGSAFLALPHALGGS